jgi:rubrerythrin
MEHDQADRKNTGRSQDRHGSRTDRPSILQGCIKNTKTPRKEVFSRMAEEEMGHFRYLRHQYRFILDTGNYDFTRKLLKSPKKGASSPIFSKEIKKRIKSSHFEVSALSIGMKLEMEAFSFYRKCATKATTPAAKKFYNELAEWEQGHYQAFKNQLSVSRKYFAADHYLVKGSFGDSSTFSEPSFCGNRSFQLSLMRMSENLFTRSALEDRCY